MLFSLATTNYLNEIFFTLFDMVKENVFELLQAGWTLEDFWCGKLIAKMVAMISSLSYLHPLQSDLQFLLWEDKISFSTLWTWNGLIIHSLWVIGYGTNNDVPVLFLGSKSLLCFCCFCWTFASTIRISLGQPALGQETKWNKVKSFQLWPSRLASF